MSKNITIAEGRTAKAFTNVAKIETKLEGSDGTQLWIPEDEAVNYTDLDVLEVSDNGFYEASDYDHDGWKEVSVYVPDTPIPEAGEVDGIASTDIDKYESVKVVTKTNQEITFVTDSTQDGFVRKNFPKSVYKLVNNRYNRYNLLSGNLLKAGTSTVYSVTILNGGRCAVLSLNNPEGDAGTKSTYKYRFMWYDGTNCDIDIEHVRYRYATTKPIIGCSNNYIAIVYGISNGSTDNANVNIYDKNGKLITKNLSKLSLAWSGSSERRLYNIVPITRNKVAGWYETGNATLASRNVLITRNGMELNLHNKNSYNQQGRWIGSPSYYQGYFYYATITSSTYQLYRIKANDIVSDYELWGPVFEKIPGEVNIFGHFQAYTTVDEVSKYRLYNIKSMTDVYPGVLANSASHFLHENQKYLIFGKTYLKEPTNIITPTSIYPESHSNNVVLGVMKSGVKGGDIGTVLVLFT